MARGMDSRSVTEEEVAMLRLLVVLSGIALGAWGAFIDLPAQDFSLGVGDGPEATLTFAPFDDLNGARRLAAVTLSLDAALGAAATAENLSDQPNTLTLRLLDGRVLASAPGSLAADAVFSFAPVAAAVAPADGTPGSGPDYHDFGTVSAAAGTVTAMLTSNLDGYLGPDPVPVILDAGGIFFVSGTADHTYTTNVTATGSAAVRYTYDVVPTPEPSGVLLLWLGALLVLWHRQPRREAVPAV